MLHDKNLAKNPWEKFQDIEWKINAKTTTTEIADVIAKYREEISTVLNANEAEWTWDESTLKGLKDLLEERQNNILKSDLWKSAPWHIDLSNNTAVATFWKKIKSSWWNIDAIDASWAATDAQKSEILNKIQSSLANLQFLHDDWTGKRQNSWKLFWGKSTNMADISATLWDTQIDKLLNVSSAAQVDAKLNTFVNSVTKKWWNAFFVEHSKLNDIEERKTSIRVAGYLYLIWKTVEDNLLTKDLYNQITKELDEQIIPQEIPKIKGLHNAKVELWHVAPEYETLRDLNVKKWNIDLWEKDLWTTSLTENRDLKNDFENGIATWLENYKIDVSSIEMKDNHWNSIPITLNDWVRDLTDSLDADIRNTKTADIVITIWWNKLKIGKIAIDNQEWNPNLVVTFEEKTKIQSEASTLWITLPDFPLDFSFKVKWTKKVSNWLWNCKACLTKKYSTKLKMNGVIPPPPPPTPVTAKEWTATISSVENVHSEEAAYIAEEKDREEFDKLWELSLMKLSTWHPWSRVKHFISREYKRNKIIKKHMQAVKGKIDIRRDSVISAANRHELQNSDDQRKGNIDNLVTHENADVNQLCVKYLKTNMNDAAFEKEFNAIIAVDPVIEPMIKNNDMNYLGSNILLKLKQERAEQVLMDKIWKLLLKDINADPASLEMKDTYDEWLFKSELQKYSDEYFQATQSNFPPEIRKLLDSSSDKNLILPILQNWKAQLQANVKNLRMQLQLLNNTTWAYEIDNKDREKSLWQRFWNWMDNHRVLTIWGSALIWTWLLAWWSLIWGPLGAWIATWLLATKMWVISAAKKASHYTKEQKWQEKRLTHWLNIEKQNMENIRKVMEWAPWYSRRKYKAKRQYQLYQETTQHKIADTEYLTKKIKGVLSSTLNLDAPENKNDRDILEGYLINALVRLDYYKESGHNFVASQNRTKIEQDFNTLYQAVQDWVFRLNESKLSSSNPRDKVIKDGLDAIRTWDPRYTDLHDQLESDYDKALSTFKKRRWALERKYWIASGAIYASTAVLAQYLSWSWIFGHYQTVTTIPWTTISQLHPDVKNSLLSNGVPSSKVTAIENALKSAPTSWWSYNPEAFWTIVKQETGWSDAQLNDWVSNSFMKDVLWKLNEGWTSEFKNALMAWHFDSLRPWDAAFSRAEAFLSSPRIWILRPWEGTTVLKNLQDYLSWAKNYTDFDPVMRMKMWHFGHMAIHNDIWIWSRLTEEVLNTVTTPGKEEVTEGVKHLFFDGVGMPIYANTYRKKMIPTEEEKWEALQTTDPWEIPEWEEFITTDPDWSSWWPSSWESPTWL